MICAGSFLWLFSLFSFEVILPRELPHRKISSGELNRSSSLGNVIEKQQWSCWLVGFTFPAEPMPAAWLSSSHENVSVFQEGAEAPFFPARPRCCLCSSSCWWRDRRVSYNGSDKIRRQLRRKS